MEQGDPERVCGELVAEWAQLEHGWSVEGEKDRAARWAPGCVVRVAIGGVRGVGGRRFLGMTPAPVRWSALTDKVPDRRNVRGLPISIVDDAFG